MLQAGTRSINRAVKTKTISGGSSRPKTFYSKADHPQNYRYSFRKTDCHAAVYFEGTGKGLGAGNGYNRHEIVKQMFIRKYSSIIKAPKSSILPPHQDVQAKGRDNKIIKNFGAPSPILPPPVDASSYSKYNNGSVAVGGDTIDAATKVPILPPHKNSDSLNIGRKELVSNESKRKPIMNVSDERRDDLFLRKTGDDCIKQFISEVYWKLDPDIMSLHGLWRHVKTSKTSFGQTTWWSKEFMCPLSGLKFQSTIFSDYAKTSSTFLASSDPKEIDGRIYYDNEQLALRACFASALDSIYHSSVALEKCLVDEKLQESNDLRYCVEEPRSFHIIEASTRLNLIPSVLLAYQKIAPDGRVDFFPRLKLNLSTTKKHIVHEKVSSTWWTSIFQCPLTRHEFKSGTFLEEHLSVIASTDKEAKIIDGRVYYARKADAERACFARLLDSLNMSFLEDEIHSNPVWRYCHEQPYSLILPSEEYNIQALGEELAIVDGLSSTEPMTESELEVLGEKIDEETFFEEGNRIYHGESWKFHPTVYLANLFRAYNPRDLRASMIPSLVTYSRSQETPNKFEWTAVFESPVTSEKFPSGRLKGAEYHLADDGIAYYSSKKAARDAAIGRAVDCFIRRKGWISHEEGKYTFPDRFLDIDLYCYDKDFHSSQNEKHEIIIGEFNPPEKKKKENDGNKRPRDYISTGYQALLREPMPGDCFKCESIDIDIEGETVPYFTSSFECPVTGQIFYSGTLLNMEVFGTPKSSAPPMKLIDGHCYYSQSKNAIHAAAGSAMDVLTATNFFSSFGRFDHKVIPRFCEEDPYISIGEQFSHEVEEGDDDYVIQNIPQAGGDIKKKSSRSTLEVVLDAWADDSIFNKSLFPSQPDALQTALSWLEKLKSEKYNAGTSKSSRYVAVSVLRQTAITTFSCNAILKALANTLLNNDVAVDAEIEHVANQIIDLMKVLSNETRPFSCAPDIETYNNYIRCLGAASPTDRAKKAEDILEKMMSEKIDEYPAPNCGSFNAVMKHWLEVPGAESYTKISALFSRMENTPSCTPNRKSFLIALMSLASSAIGLDPTNSPLFHPEVTSQWIERMHKYKTEHDNCAEMKADAEIFNAALPLCTDHSEIESSLRQIFETDFHPKLPESHPRRQDAINIEKWFYSMEHRSKEKDAVQIAPDIHTLEAVIQAWIRTGSEEGIRNAEKWAIDASEAKIVSLITPRLETFYPILLAWSMSGGVDAPSNIKALLNKMDALGERIPELKPSSDLRSLLINAWKKHQDDNEGNPKAILDIAEESTEYLISLAEATEDLKYLDGNVFEMVIDMWGAATHNSIEEQSRIQSQLLAVVKQYNRLLGTHLVWDFDEEDDHYHDDNSTHRNRSHLKIPEMSTAIDSLYSKLISTTLNFFGDDEQFRQSIIEEFFHEVEGHLLRREKYQANIVSYGDVPLSFPENLYKDALKWCNFLKDERRSGDAVRVAFQILLDTTSNHRQDQINLGQATEIYSDVIAVINSVVVNPDEKRLVIRRAAEEIMASNCKNEAFLKRTFSAGNIDISDILAKDFSPSKEQRRTKKGSKRKRVRRRKSKT